MSSVTHTHAHTRAQTHTWTHAWCYYRHSTVAFHYCLFLQLEDNEIKSKRSEITLKFMPVSAVVHAAIEMTWAFKMRSTMPIIALENWRWSHLPPRSSFCFLNKMPDLSEKSLGADTPVLGFFYDCCAGQAASSFSPGVNRNPWKLPLCLLCCPSVLKTCE